MNIIATNRTVIEYHLTLSAEDAQSALDNPWTLGEQIREQLLPQMPGATGGGVEAVAPARRGRRPNKRSQITIGKGARKAHPKNGRGRQSSPAGMVREGCPICGEMITMKYMALHRRTKHGSPSTTGNGARPEAVPAAG